MDPGFEIRIDDVLDSREWMRLPGEQGVFSTDGETLAVTAHDISLHSLDSTARLDLYDVPFRGPFGPCFILGLISGVLAFFLVDRLFRPRKTM
jgi:hypothetical protein